MSLRLQLSGISKRYGEGAASVLALDSVSLALAAGEFLVVEGPSGSGKSTLLSICGLLESADEGSMRFDGVAVERLTAEQRCGQRRKSIGLIFQHHQLIPAMTVFENIAYPLVLNREPRARIQSQVELIMDRVGLGARRNHLPKRLSGGERQRTAIARALIKRPRIVIADEPSASLDHQRAHECLTLMRELNTEIGASFLIASHDPFVIGHCDRKIILRDGRLVNGAAVV